MNKIIICSYDKKLLPIKMTNWAVCYDMFCEYDFEIEPWEVKKVTTWVKTCFPIWWHAKVFARSSLPIKAWLMIANNVAIFDADFRWNYIMQFYNYTNKKLSFKKYTRLTQMEICPYYIDSWVYWTKQIPEIKFIIDKEIYNDFENKFESDRWRWGLGSTG